MGVKYERREDQIFPLLYDSIVEEPSNPYKLLVQYKYDGSGDIHD